MADSTQAILLRIGADVSQLRKELGSGSKSFNAFTQDIDIGRNTLVRFAGTIAAGLGLAKLASEALEFADHVRKVADQTGVTTDEVQKLQFIASQTGVSVDTLASTISRMQKTLVDASEDGKRAREAIEGLGVNILELMNKRPADQFQELSEAIARIPDPAKQAATAQEIFGKAGADNLPMMKAMAEQGEALAVQFEAIGPASEDAINAVDGIGDKAAEAAVAAKTFAVELLGVVAPAIISGLNAVEETLGGIRVLLGKGANEVVNLSDKIEELDAAIERASSGLARGLVSPERIAQLQQARDELVRQQQVLLGVGEAGAAATAPLVDFTNVILEMPVLTDYALGLVDERLDASVQEMLKRQEKVRQMQQEDAELRAEIAQFGADKIEEVEGAHFSKMQDFYLKSWDAQTQIVAGSLQEMTAGIAQHSKTAFEVNKLASIANAIVNTIQAVTKAWADYGWPWGAVVGAAIAAAGVGQVNAIKNTKFNGGGSGVPPSGATTPPVNTATQGNGGGGGGAAGQGSVLRVEGLGADAMFDGKTVRVLAEKLVEHQKNGGTVVFQQ